MLPFDDQQRRAIEIVDRDLLVAASAGSGKTTVLAHRCVHLLRQGRKLDQLLAVTFTEAAAADMRAKIALALREELEENPDEHLDRQLRQLERASISTLHAFSGNVCRSQAQFLGLDPAFRVLDEDEAELLRFESADSVLERWFAKEESAATRFHELVEAYGGRRGGERLIEILLQLHEFLQTLVDPAHWCRATLAAYEAREGMAGTPWGKAFRERLGRELISCLGLADHAKILAKPFEKYLKHVQDIQIVLRSWSKQSAHAKTDRDFGELLTAIRDIKWDKLPTVKGEDAEDAKEAINKLKAAVQKRLSKTLCVSPPQRLVEDLQAVAPLLSVLFDVQSDFQREYAARKSQQSQLDFDDLEHNCLRLLCSHPQAAHLVRARYTHLMVDEYQDINPIQDQILRELIRRGEDAAPAFLCLIGDHKQSIYSFRLADPTLFLEKREQYSLDLEELQVRVPLTGNYRSRPHILAAVNYICRQIFHGDLGGAYTNEDELTAGLEYPADSRLPARLAVQIHLLEKTLELDSDDEEAEWAESSALEREAYLVAQRIKEIVGTTQIYDSDKQEYRNARYRDIVLLMRSMRGKAESVSGVLRSQGIPIYADLNTGFFDATEVKDILCLLEILENAQQDVPTAAVLRSPLVGLNEDQLATIRLHAPQVAYHQAVVHYAHDGPIAALRERLQTWLEQLELWRADVSQMPLAWVLWNIYRETGYLLYVQRLPGGAGRRANLMQLHDRARQFDQFSRRGLFRFLRFLKRLQETEHDFGSAPTLSEADDVVRLLSIHKSKGLEFPIVFLLDLGKAFNKQDQREQILLHRKLLLGIDRVDLEHRVKSATLPRMVVSEQKRLEMLAEEQRLLYVAMTRAREHLILLGTTSLNRQASGWKNFKQLEANCPLDWLGPVLARHPDTAFALGGSPEGDGGGAHFKLHLHEGDTIKTWQPTKPLALELPDGLKPMLELKPLELTDKERDDPAVAEVRKRLAWTYPARNLRKYPGKTSPSGFKKLFPAMSKLSEPPSIEEDDLIDFMRGADDMPGAEVFDRRAVRKPVFLSELPSRVSAVEKGTATHAVLQHLNLQNKVTKKALHEHVADLITRRILGKPEAQELDIESIYQFLRRTLGERLRKARRCERELPFNLLLPAGELPLISDQPLTPEESREGILIQGVIDCLFWEGDEIILVDYKTDNVTADGIGEKVQLYASQLMLYRKAIAAIYRREVKESWLAFLTPGRDVITNHD